MTGAAMLNLMMARLGGRTQPALRATMLLEANFVQQNVLEGDPIKPWFMVSEDTEATLTVGERRLAVPDDFMCEVEDEEGGLIIVDSNGIEHQMVKKSWDQLVDENGLEATADLPLEYALVGEYFMIFPLPNIALTVKMRYKARQDAIADDNTENNWLKYASDWLMAELGVVMCSKHVRDEPQKLSEFAADVIRAKKRVSDENTARAEANRSRSMG